MHCVFFIAVSTVQFMHLMEIGLTEITTYKNNQGNKFLWNSCLDLVLLSCQLLSFTHVKNK